MPISVQGFGQRIDRKDLKPGEVLVGLRGADTYFMMRVGHGPDHQFDLVLALLQGDVKPNITFPRLTGDGQFHYVSVAGQVVARPAKFAIPTDSPVNGSLVLDAQGNAFVRCTNDGVEYYSLDTGLEGRPGDARTYYNEWDAVQVLGPQLERVIARIASSRDSSTS